MSTVLLQVLTVLFVVSADTPIGQLAAFLFAAVPGVQVDGIVKFLKDTVMPRDLFSSIPYPTVFWDGRRPWKRHR